MSNKLFKMNSKEFALLSETHLKLLISAGAEIEITDLVNTKSTNETTSVVSKPATTPTKVEATKPATTKGKDKKPTSPKGETKSSKTNSFGKVKVGDYYAQYNLVTNKIVKVGYCKTIKDGFIVVYDNDKEANKVCLDNCKAISRKEYNSLKKELSKESSAKQDRRIWKLAYALNLLKQGKISNEDFAKAKTDDKFSSELYHKFKAEITLEKSNTNDLITEVLKDLGAKVEA